MLQPMKYARSSAASSVEPKATTKAVRIIVQRSSKNGTNHPCGYSISTT
jgi:hypothetical protein